MVVTQKVDELAVFLGDGTQTYPAPEFVPSKFSQPLAKFLQLVLAYWHDGAGCQDSQFILQQVEEHVVKTIDEKHVVLVGNL